MEKIKYSNCEKKYLKNQIETKLNLYQNSKSQIVTKLKNSKCYKTQTMTNPNLWGEKIKGPFSRKNGVYGTKKNHDTWIIGKAIFFSTI